MKRRAFLQLLVGGVPTVLFANRATAAPPVVDVSEPPTTQPDDHTFHLYIIGAEYSDGSRERFWAYGGASEKVIDPITFERIDHASVHIDYRTSYKASLIVNLTLGKVLKSRITLADPLSGWTAVPMVDDPRYKRET